MYDIQDLEKRQWWTYIAHDLQELLKESLILCDRVERWDEEFHDYSFIVFPAAKAYEGFLKKFFLDMGFITKGEYDGKRFRIGRALNPSLEKDPNEESVYEKIERYCGGQALAKELWETWKMSRNLLFHWFPNEANAVSLMEAQTRVKDVVHAIDFAYKECTINMQPD